MSDGRLFAQASAQLRYLASEIPSRRVGSDGNRAAADYFAGQIARHGFAVESQPFACVDWQGDGARLTVASDDFAVLPSPYSLGCRVHGPLVVVTTVEELARADLDGSVLLLRGEIAGEPLMPKNFPFYNPESHRQIVDLLEAKRPAAIVTATVRNPELAGAVYPLPMFEDGDFDIPSVYLTEAEGVRLAAYSGRQVELASAATRVPATGRNVVARKGGGQGHVVVFAHIDSRIGTPGANDNASGVVALMLLGELLAGYAGGLGVELVAMNGEDYYSNPGELAWLAANAGRLGDIRLGVNLDDVGYYRGSIAYSLYGCPPTLEEEIRWTFSAHPRLVEGPPWYQGDHGLFLLNDVPALALTTDRIEEVMAALTHSPKDTVETVDPRLMVETALALRDLIARLDRQ